MASVWNFVRRLSFAAVALLISSSALADVMTSGYAQVLGFSLTPSDGADSLVWTDDPFFFLAADASNSLALPASDFDVQADFGVVPDANAATPPHAQSHAAASFNGSSLSMEASGNTEILSPLVGFADANASSLFDIFFMLVGNGNGGVSLSLDYELFLSGLADAAGTFEQTAFVSLQVSEGFGGADLFSDSVFQTTGLIRNGSFNATIPGSLAGMLTLNYDTPYYLAITVDNEHRSVNDIIPEPSSMALLGMGLGVFTLVRRRSSSVSMRQR